MSDLFGTRDEALVAAAAALAPELEERAPAAERLGRVPDETIESLASAGLLNLLSPEKFGGAQVSIATFAGVSAEIARGCMSTSWVASIYNMTPYMAAVLPSAGQEELFSSANPLTASAFQPQGFAQPENGGYRLSGRWPFCSGQHHAGWCLMASMTVGPEGKPEPGLFLIPRDRFALLDEWRVSGLCATGSNTLGLHDEFVPAHRVTLLSQAPAGAVGSDSYYQVPAQLLFVALSPATTVGGAQRAVEIMGERIHKRGITYTRYQNQAEATVTHLQVAEAHTLLDEAGFHFDRALSTIAEVGANPMDLLLRVRCRADSARAIQLHRAVATIVQSACGAGAIALKDPLQRIVRDTEALSLHSYLLASTSSELYGRVLCGLDPETPFV